MQLKKNQILSLDTMAFIYYFEGQNAYASKIGGLLSRIESGYVKAFTTVVSLAEILVKPLADGQIELADEYKNILSSFPNLHMLEIDQQISTLAANLKAKYKIKLPDAMQISGGLMAGAEVFVTNDKRLKKVKEIKVLTLSDL